VAEATKKERNYEMKNLWLALLFLNTVTTLPANIKTIVGSLPESGPIVVLSPTELHLRTGGGFSGVAQVNGTLSVATHTTSNGI
jgi:hypothetical protein